MNNEGLELLQLVVESIEEVSCYEDEMPDELWEVLKNDKDVITHALRYSVNKTKLEFLAILHKKLEDRVLLSKKELDEFKTKLNL